MSRYDINCNLMQHASNGQTRSVTRTCMNTHTLLVFIDEIFEEKLYTYFRPDREQLRNTAISIKVVPKERENIEYERERLIGKD